MTSTERTPVPGGFLIPQEHLSGLCYVLKESWKPAFREVLVKHGAQFLRLSRSMGWRAQDLGFLRELQGLLRGVEIYDDDVKDVSVLAELPELELVRLQCRWKGFDFTRLPRLKLASVTWRPGSETLFSCEGLEQLFLDDAPHSDLTPLERLTGLQRLSVGSKSITSARGRSGSSGSGTSRSSTAAP